MKYKSKIDWWYYLIALIFSISTYRVLYMFAYHARNKNNWQLMTLFVLCEFLIVLPNLLFTYYIFEEETLYIRHGYFHTKDIRYQDIVKIRETRSLLSPCGMSAERIEVTYKCQDSIDSVLVSPKHKQEFLQQLYEKVKAFATNQGLMKYLVEDEDKNDPMDGIIR